MPADFLVQVNLIMLDSAGTRGVELSVEVNGKIVKVKMTVCAEGEYDMDAGACDKDQTDMAEQPHGHIRRNSRAV